MAALEVLANLEEREGGSMGDVRGVNPSQAVQIACLVMESHDEDDAIAATVEEEAVYAGQVDDYILRFRRMAGLSKDSAWKAWLKQSGLDDKQVRADTIAFLVDHLLIERAARERGVSVGQWDVQRQLDTVMATPDSAAHAYMQLIRLGITEEQFAEGIRANLLRAALIDDVVAERLEQSSVEFENRIAHAAREEGALRMAYEVFDRWFADWRRSADVEILRSD